MSIDSEQSRAALYAQHYLGLVRLARQFVDDLDTAEDVVQDVFAGLPDTTPTDPLRYLRRAVVNRCRSVLRRRRTVRSYLQRAPDLPGDAPAADVDVLGAEGDRVVLAAIAALPRRQQEVIVLRYYEDLSVAEVAAVLGIRAAAVSTSTRRALATLEQRLEGRP
ncbi:RNA polymerase sigma factor [uncultured Jatrophihabitans sp.]|uniref:RNA polymerase sigma factor n=1 Tax=uncultured Jatrophihabitans sp. TaxID=1610747 RepID=UPI0035CAC184